MSKRVIGLILNLVVCLAIGYFAGQKFYSVFRSTVPSGCMSDALQITAKGAYIGLGLMVGGVLFLWSTAAAWMARFFPAGAKATSTATTASTR